MSQENPFLFDNHLIQSKFPQAIFTGLINKNYELRHLLKSPKSDLLETVSLAVIDET